MSRRDYRPSTGKGKKTPSREQERAYGMYVDLVEGLKDEDANRSDEEMAPDSNGIKVNIDDFHRVSNWVEKIR